MKRPGWTDPLVLDGLALVLAGPLLALAVAIAVLALFGGDMRGAW